MSENIPESIPTSADPRSNRPIKKSRTILHPSASSTQAASLSKLFSNPSTEIRLPPSTSTSLTVNKSTLPPPPEIVANVQGSSAGAGSGEFHVYKASRRREYERMRGMEEEVRGEEERVAWEVERERRERVDEERTRRNRERRMGKKRGKGAGGKDGKDGDGGKEGKKGGVGIKPRGLVGGGDRDGDEEVGVEGKEVEGKEVVEQGLIIHDDD